MRNLEGKILTYRMFDVGSDFDLSQVEQRLSQFSSTQRAKLARPTRSIVIREAPIVLQLDSVEWQYGEENKIYCKFDIQLKIWSFGVISLVFIYDFLSLDWEQLIYLGAQIENDQNLSRIAMEKAYQVLKIIDPQRELAQEVVEDYLIYFFKSLPGFEKDINFIFREYNITGLLLTESSNNFGDQVYRMIWDSVIQYNKNDAYIVTWNSALVIEPTGVLDVPDIIEFALCQVLEMRYYDQLLEKKLKKLYDNLEKRKWNVFKNQAEELAEEAAKYYLEISETIENVNNSLKVIGDFYLAQIFKLSSQRFRFQDWKEGVNQKLKNLTEISSIINNQVNARRGHLLELIIIILIAIELIPLLVNLFFN